MDRASDSALCVVPLEMSVLGTTARAGPTEPHTVFRELSEEGGWLALT